MTNFYMLVGIPGSGKSMWAEKHKEEYNYNILSSDTLRIELFNDVNFQKDNAQVFHVMRKRTLENLKNRNNVCYDATNINRKSRKGIMAYINQECLGVKKIAIVFATPYDVCLENNNNRERVVPKEVLDRMISNFEIPSYAEGFDEIKIIQNYPTAYDYTDAYLAMQGFDQKNPHHALDLMRHCEKCQDYVLQKNDILDVIPEIAMAALLHDYGKLFTASWDKEKSCNHYYNHENVGAYKLLTECRFPSWIDINDVIFYINYHMLPYSLKKMSDKKREYTIKQFSKNKFKWEALNIIHEGDEYAHN